MKKVTITGRFEVFPCIWDRGVRDMTFCFKTGTLEAVGVGDWKTETRSR